MKNRQFYSFLHRQILVLIALSLAPGLGYLLLGWLYDALLPVVAWYGLMLIMSAWGYTLYRRFDYDSFTRHALHEWYREASWFYYIVFSLWTLIFVLIVPKTEHNLHYVAIFTQIGAAVVSSTLLFCDRKLFMPTNAILVAPLMIYFAQIAHWYGYILTIFSGVFWWVLHYASSSSNQLLQQTYIQSSRDQLTDMYNRAFFIDAMEQTVNSLKSNQYYACLILIDLDYFKTINDSLGHDIGDVLLREVADRMKRIVPAKAIAARMGGDEFIIITEPVQERDAAISHALALSESLRETLKQTYKIDRHHLYISASIGVSVIHNPTVQANKYIKEADIAMYEVKDRGRDGVILFSDDVSERVEKNLEIERLLHFSLENNEIYLNYQPQFDKDQHIVGCEVLVRWQNRELGAVSPERFIPIAEKTGLIIEIGNFVIEQALKTLAEWESKGISLQSLSINISMRQFFYHSFVRDVKRLCQQYLEPEQVQKIVFEVTESTLADELDKLVEIMQELRSDGMSFSIDDFGTGYSSLGYLRQVPLDEVKIDRSFTSELTADESSQAMVKTILHLAEIYNLKVVAEGVETQQQQEILLDNHCHLLQGYLLARPVAKDEFESLYKSNHARD
jgi:diguanylate cyclase (GGDEF)-like protein